MESSPGTCESSVIDLCSSWWGQGEKETSYPVYPEVPLSEQERRRVDGGLHLLPRNCL